ncbi:hypothetical protein [Sphingomonas sp. Leaf242]|uniref:hypothetical protein n=1 Tax=Sphingomonas sp. Leaf242 TaxID=1736304 RepID=UPI00071256B6|nr:hypothetical protein [Sphingomonas sp. Leaf242]KQO07245.1 hypothetical protein ASF09_13625 [Sphingomonas sp. Leaf242]
MSDQHWPDALGRINTSNSAGVYYNNYSDTAGANRIGERAPGYKASLSVMASSRRKVLVTLNFFALSGYGFSSTAGEMQRAKDTLVDQVRSLWNQRRLRLILFVLDERGRSTDVSRSLDVEFRIRWTRSMASADYVLCVYPTQNDLPMVPGRTDRPPFVMSGAWTQSHRIEMHIAATEQAWTFSHEFGHCIGLPDEYSHPGVGYFKPDGREGLLLQRPDAFIPANRQGGVTSGRRNSDLRTEMSTNPNSNLLPRHLWPTAIEVRRLVNRLSKSTKFGVDVNFSR